MLKLIYPFLLIISLIAISCSNNTNTDLHQSGRVLKEDSNININVNTSLNKSRSFHYIDIFDDLISVNLNKTDSGNHFDISTTAPFILLSEEHNHCLFYIRNHEKLNLKANGVNDLSFESGNKVRNNELSFFVEYIKQLPKTSQFYTLIPRYIRLIKNPHLKDSLESDYKQQIKYLNNYKKTKNISAEFENYCRNYFYYNFLNESFSSDIFNHNFKSTVDYKNFFMVDSLCDNLNYRKAAVSLNNLLTGLPIQKFIVQKGGVYSTPVFKALFNTAKNNFKGRTRDYLLFQLLKFNMQSPFKGFENYLHDFYKTNSTKQYENYLKENYILLNENLISEAFKTSLLLNYKNEKVKWEEVIKPGKVIYVDFWASWCTPCIEEIPISKKLNVFFDKNKVEFVYISLDKNKVAYENSMKELGLNPRNCYLLINDFKSPVAKKFTIKTIPRYFLIDQKGKYINTDAFRPSSIGFKEKINKLLN